MRDPTDGGPCLLMQADGYLVLKLVPKVSNAPPCQGFPVSILHSSQHVLQVVRVSCKILAFCIQQEIRLSE